MRPLYCDESTWVPVVDGLRHRGWTAHVARDEGMLGEPDRDHLALVEENDWILITLKDDFLSLIETEGLAHSGVLLVNQAGRDIGAAVKAVDAHLDERSRDDHGVHYL